MLAVLTVLSRIYLTTFKCFGYINLVYVWYYTFFFPYLSSKYLKKYIWHAGNMVQPCKGKAMQRNFSHSEGLGYGCVDVEICKKLTWYRSLKSNIILQPAIERTAQSVFSCCQTKEQTNSASPCLQLSMK